MLFWWVREIHGNDLITYLKVNLTVHKPFHTVIPM